MSKRINIQKLFTALDEEMRLKLSSKIDEIYHPTAKGYESELNWIGLLRAYLPERYTVDSGFVVDHKGNISEQIDIVVYDRHFTPFIFRGENVVYIPAEGVYAIFEVKPHFDQKNCNYAVKKLKSVKALKRTSASFSHILGKDKKEPFDVVGGILTKEIKSKKCFDKIKIDSELSIVLSLDYGIKVINDETIEKQDKEPILAFFLLKLIEKLRALGSVPALEVDKYLEFLKKGGDEGRP
ncbi:MAG: hypothetical protein Q8O04_09470 [Deltaproteobacteria bacterium]|nr:hypothetical protein [Deltaproteobacteria bacterium]